MAFVFRSERNFDYQKDSNVDSFMNNDDKDKINKINSDIITKLKKKEKKKKLNKETINSNISNKNNPPFSSTSEKVTMNIKEDTPGPGSYNINKLYYNRHKHFSSREGFSDSIDFEYINLPSIRLKEVVNNNPGPGQYNPSEKDLFGAKFKKLYNIKANNKKRNISKSANDILIKRKDSFNNINNKINNIKDFVFVYSTKTKAENSNKNNDKTCNSSSILNNKETSTIRNNESEIIIKKKINKNNSHMSAATLDTQRSSFNTSRMTLTNPRNVSSKILIPKLDNSEIKKCFEPKKNSDMENNQNFMLNTIEADYGIYNKFGQFPQFKYDKTKIFKSSQDHERIMLINEDKNNYSQKFNSQNELLVDQELFLQTPGPGYYSPIEPVNQKYFHKKNISNTGILDYSKIKILKRISPGPGEYKIDNYSIENTLRAKTNNAKSRSALFDVKKIAKLRLAKEKESSERNKKLKFMNSIDNQLKITYDNNNKEIYENQKLQYNKKKIRKLLFNFGSNSQRFYIHKQKIPGVGQYDINNYKSIEEKNINIVENPSYEELLQKMENKNDLLERSPLNKDLINNPAVGQYNPDIISSIKYNFEIKNMINTQPMNKKLGYKKVLEEQVLKRAKEIKEKEKQLINLLGPGKYFNMLNKTFNLNKGKNKLKGIRPAFGSSGNKFENVKQTLSPGPGQYDINSYYNWITRTYNILFY